MAPSADASSRPRAGRVLFALTGLAWALTMALLVRSEVLGRSGEADSRALVAQAGLVPARSTARWALLVGGVELGELSSSLVADTRRGQRAWSFGGRLQSPVRVRLRGTALADAEGRLERLVAEVEWEAAVHRLSLLPGEAGGPAFLARWQPPAGGEVREWPVEEAPRLLDLPLPLPAGLAGLAAADGTHHPLSGVPMDWRVGSRWEPGPGALGPTLRSEVEVGGVALVVLQDGRGLPVEVSLPGRARLVLVEQTP